jgi:carbamoyl-phosphate synthase large subunit
MRGLNVLVLGVGGNVSQSIQKALSLASTPTKVIAACTDRAGAGLYVADTAYLSPLAQDPQFVGWLLDVCKRERIDAVLSGSEPVLEALAPEAAALRERTGAIPIVSSEEVVRIGHDKLRTCRWLESAGLPVPGYADCADADAVAGLVERVGFPLVAKPRGGKGSHRVSRIESERGLEQVVGSADMIVQEHLGDEQSEYTAGCFCDSTGEPRGTIVFRRSLQAGTTVVAEAGDFPDVRATAEAIVSALGPLGPCNIQLRVHHGRAVPFEINPRFSGTTAMRARMGFNEVDAALRHFVLGEPAQQLLGAAAGVALRYWNEVYVPAGVFERMGADRRLENPLELDVKLETWGLREPTG